MDNVEAEHDITFTKTNRGHRQLLRNGHMYNFHRQGQTGSTTWRCVHRSSCSALLKIEESENNIRVLGESNHKCNPSTVKIELRKIVNECKEQAAAGQYVPMPTLFENTIEKSKDAGYDLLNAIPQYSKIKRTLYNVRNRSLNVPKTHFTKREDIIIPDKYKTEFLLFDDTSDPQNRIIAFSTMDARSVIMSLDILVIDGTFRSCCNLFKQLYCLHGDVHSTKESTNIMPLIFVLMPNKEQNTYIRLFMHLKEYLPGLTPTTFIVDYEMAAINALKTVFPDSAIQGCNFHFKQALVKKSHALGLNSSEEKTHIAKCASLAYLREEDIDDGWLCVMENAPSTEAVTAFNDYFVSQWLENDHLQRIWNCHGARHRTINGAESWHKRLNNRMSTQKPKLLHFLDVIKREAEYTDFRLRRTASNVMSSLRKKRSIETDQNIKKITENYDKSDLAKVIRQLSIIQNLRQT